MTAAAEQLISRRPAPPNGDPYAYPGQPSAYPGQPGPAAFNGAAYTPGVRTMAPPKPGEVDETGQVEPLGGGWITVTVVIGVMAALIALGGMVLSFRAVSVEMVPSFGSRWSWMVPIVVDLTVFVFSGVDLVLARMDMSHPLARWTVYGATAGTVYLNYNAGGSLPGRVAHVLMPSIWVVFIELMRHVVRRQTNLATGSRREPIPATRWMVSPWPTLKLWRRMVLWRINSYPRALAQEKARLGAIAAAREVYGRNWRWKISPLVRLQIELGEAGAAEIYRQAAVGRAARAGRTKGSGARGVDPGDEASRGAAAAAEGFPGLPGLMIGPDGAISGPGPDAFNAGYQSFTAYDPYAAQAAPLNRPRIPSSEPGFAQAALAALAERMSGPMPGSAATAAVAVRPEDRERDENDDPDGPTDGPYEGANARTAAVVGVNGAGGATRSVNVTGVNGVASANAVNGAAAGAHRGGSAEAPAARSGPAHAVVPAPRSAAGPAAPRLDFQAPPPAPAEAPTPVKTVPPVRRSVRESELLTAAREVERWRGMPSATRISRELGIGMPLATSLANALREEEGLDGEGLDPVD